MVDRAVKERGTGAVASFKCIVRIVYATELKPYFVGNRAGRVARRLTVSREAI